MFKRILYSIHRILGTILSILLLVWFLSGFVMIYHTFPRVSNEDKYEHMDAIQGNIIAVDSAIIDIAEQQMILKFALKTVDSKPIYEIMSMEGITRYSAIGDTTVITSGDTSFSQIRNYAQLWCHAPIARVDTLNELEQWIPFSYLRKDFPIYKFHFADDEKHQLYVSSTSGEALQFTSKESRFWAWLGAIPHWIYFTSLRQDAPLWMEVVIWLSGVGCIMCIAGIIIGVRSYIKRYQLKNKWESPYKKAMYKWHHITGFVFGIFVFTFTFSGMMSLTNVPQWLVKTHNPDVRNSFYMPQPISFQDFKLTPQQVLAQYQGKVKTIEWNSFGNVPYYKVICGKEILYINASDEEVESLNLSETAILDKVTANHSEDMQISLITEYDNYYVDRKGQLPLPVYKVDVADTDNSTYYIDPKTVLTRYYNTNSKVHRWTYQVLHSYSFKLLAENAILWNIVMWLTMIGGTLVSATGVWISIRYLKRKCRWIKKKCNHKS